VAYEVTESEISLHSISAISEKRFSKDSVILCFPPFFLCVKILHASKASMHLRAEGIFKFMLHKSKERSLLESAEVESKKKNTTVPVNTVKMP
jgi:hypothetical protein